MPAPPITIGEIPDVPTYDSPIASPWAQEVTRRCAHRFASTAERDAKYPAASAGAGAICVVGRVLYTSDGTTWLGRLRVLGTAIAPASGPIPPGFLQPQVMGRLTIPFACNVRADITVLLAGPGTWSGTFRLTVNGTERFLFATDSAGQTSLDAHPFIDNVPAGAVLELTAHYGPSGIAAFTWYADAANFQFSAECGQS